MLNGEIEYLVDPTKEWDELLSDSPPIQNVTKLKVEARALTYCMGGHLTSYQATACEGSVP